VPGADHRAGHARGGVHGGISSCPLDPADFSPAVAFERSFDAQIGLSYDRIEEDQVVGTFEVRADLLDHSGRLHGGVLTAVAEGAASMGTAAGVMSEGMTASGMSNDTSIVAGVGEGRMMTAVARRRAAAPDLWAWDVEISDEDGRTCSLSKVLIAVRPMRVR
jgi:1,4-dihydroxy-2-naphthoyl-CoA hydrolase